MLRTPLPFVLLVLALASVARAQEGAPDSFALAPLQNASLLEAWATDPLLPGDSALAVGLQVHPFEEVRDPEDVSAAVAGSLATAGFLGTLGLFQGVDLSAGLTAVNFEPTGNSHDRRASLGNLRLVPRLRLFGGGEQSGGAFLLDGTVPLDDPTGNRRAASAEPRIALSQPYDWARMTLNAGYRVHLGERSVGSSRADAFGWALGSLLPIVGAWSGMVELSGHVRPRDAGQTWRDRSPTEARVAARFGVANWAAEFGAGAGLLGGRDEADWRLFAAVSISPPSLPSRHPGADARKPTSSSLAHAEDECSAQLLTWNGGSIPEACAMENLSAMYQPDAEVECATDPTGCEPDANAAETTNSEPQDATGGIEIVPLPTIETRVQFPPNSHLPDRSQAPFLDEVARQMKDTPDDVRFVIEGHSDAAGPDAFNWRLSQARAIVVRRLLIERGVPWRRLTIAWYGSTRPLELTDEKHDRTSDRRVEFRAERVIQ